MGLGHSFVVALLAPCVAMVGCQSSVRAPVAVVSYQPGTPLKECAAPRSRVYALVRLPTTLPVRVVTQPQRTSVAMAKPVEVERVYAGRGAPVGFRRDGSQLIAVAGPTQSQLVEARYAWRFAGPNPSGNALHPRTTAVLQTTLGFVGVVTCVALVLYLVHADRHSLLSDAADPG